MMGKTLGWLGLTVGKPQGRSLCAWGVASGSAASHPDPGSSGMVEFSEESPFFCLWKQSRAICYRRTPQHEIDEEFAEMKFPRSSGILLHPTSLPGRFGIGDLGPCAHEFVDFLAEVGQRWWQVLPLGPTGGMNSPYQSYSSFAGNPLLISPEAMVERGWLRSSDLNDSPTLPTDQVDFIGVARSKENLLRRAFQTFSLDDPGYQEFLTASSGWLDDYALFVALKEANGGKAWYQWERQVVARKASELARWR